MHLLNTDDLPSRCTVLYQGPSGSGKTHNALTWPNPGVIYTEANRATLRKFSGTPIVLLDRVEELETKVLPSLEGRDSAKVFGKEVNTIVLDSASATLGDLMRSIQGSKESMTQQDFGRFLVRGETLIRRFVDLSRPTDTHPGYNVIMTVHQRDITNDSGNLERISPAIVGQLKDLIGRWFDTLLVCESVVESETAKDPGGKMRVTKTAVYRVHSVPPSRYYDCKDGMGGGKYKVLPSPCPGTYPELARLWGLEETR